MVTVRTLNRLLQIAFILTVILSSTSLIAQNPVGIWKLNEGSGAVAYDSSGGGHAAAVSSGMRWSKTASTWTLSADGAHSGYVTTPALNLTGTKAVTVALWVKRKASPTTGGTVLFEAGKDYLHSETGFALLADDDTCHGFQAVLRGNQGAAANCYAQPATGGWHHIAVVYDKSQTAGNAVSLYIDGALQTPTWNLSSATNTNNFGTDPIYLLSRGGSSQFGSGTLSDFRVYDGALSGDQIQQIYNLTMLASPGSISYVQGNYTDPMSSQNTISVPFTGAQTAGDLNVVVVGWKDSTTSVGQVTDSAGNTYALAVGPTRISGTASQSIFYAKNIVSAGAGNSVTVTFSGSARNPDVRILEYSGADPSNPLDVTAASTGSGLTANSGSATTTNATDLILGADLVQSVTASPGSGFTKRVLSSPQGNIAEDQITTTTGRYSAAATLMPASRWIMQMAAFRGHGSPTLTSITVTPANPSISVGGHQQFTATGNYSDGTHQNLTSSATWSSSYPSIATITSAGLATGVAAGSTTIKAASGSIYGTTTLTVTGAAGNFTISASPSSVSVAQGHQGTSTITTTGVNGFNSPITLSASGAPSGASVAFNPTTIPAPGSGTSAMTVTVGSSTPVGTYPITIIGTGGGIQQPTTVTLTVTAAGSGISLDGNLHGVVDNGSVSGTTAALALGTPTAGDLITCEVTFDGGNGNTLASIVDNRNGSYAAAVPVHLNSTLRQWFGIYYIQNAAASATTVTITTTQSRSWLAMSCQAWNGAATSGALDTGFMQLQDATNAPNPTTGANQTPATNGELLIASLGMNNAGSPTAGTNYALIDGAVTTQFWPEYWIQGSITSTAGNYTWPTDSWTDVMAAFRPAGTGGGGTFTLSAAPSSLTIGQGNQSTSTITASVSGGFNNSISLSASGTPTGTTVAFSPATLPAPGSGTSVMTIIVGTSTPAGTYPITVTGNGGGVQQTTTVSLTVSAGANFSISASPGSLSVMQGRQGTSTLTTTVSGGFNGSISLAATGAPTGTTISFNPTTISAPGSGSSVMTITVGGTTQMGTYPITITATGGGIQRTTTITLTVTAQIALSWTASQSPDTAGYNIYRSTSSGGQYNRINTTLNTTTSYNDQQVTDGVMYYYVTTAVDNTGMESTYSNQASAMVP
jgi:hypothetical protein